MAEGLMHSLFGEGEGLAQQNESMDRAYELYDWCARHDLKIVHGVKRQYRSIMAELPPANEMTKYVMWFRAALSSRSLFRRNLQKFMKGVRCFQTRYKLRRDERLRQTGVCLQRWAAYETRARQQNRELMIAVTREVRALRLKGKTPPKELQQRQRKVYDVYLALETPAPIKRSVVATTRRRLIDPVYRLFRLYRTRMAVRYPERDLLPDPHYVFDFNPRLLIPLVPKFQKSHHLDQLVRQTVTRRTTLRRWVHIIVRLFQLRRVLPLPKPLRPKYVVAPITRVLAYLFMNSRSAAPASAPPERPECVDLLFSGALQDGGGDGTSPRGSERASTRAHSLQAASPTAVHDAEVLEGSVHVAESPGDASWFGTTADFTIDLSGDILSPVASPTAPRSAGAHMLFPRVRRNHGTPRAADPDRQERMVRALKDLAKYIAHFGPEQRDAVRGAISHLAVQQGRVVLSDPPGFRRDTGRTGREGYVLAQEIHKLLRGEPSALEALSDEHAAPQSIRRILRRAASGESPASPHHRPASSPRAPSPPPTDPHQTPRSGTRRVALSRHVYGTAALTSPPSAPRVRSSAVAEPVEPPALSPPAAPEPAPRSPAGLTPMTLGKCKNMKQALSHPSMTLLRPKKPAATPLRDGALTLEWDRPCMASPPAATELHTPTPPLMVPLPPAVEEVASEASDASGGGDAGAAAHADAAGVVCMVGAVLAGWWGTRGRMRRRGNAQLRVDAILASEGFAAAKAAVAEGDLWKAERTPPQQQRGGERRATFRNGAAGGSFPARRESTFGRGRRKSSASIHGPAPEVGFTHPTSPELPGSTAHHHHRRRLSSNPFLFERDWTGHTLDIKGAVRTLSIDVPSEPGDPPTPPASGARRRQSSMVSPPPPRAPLPSQDTERVPWDAYVDFFDELEGRPLPECPVLPPPLQAALPRAQGVHKDDAFWNWWALGSVGLQWERPLAKGKLAPARPPPPVAKNPRQKQRGDRAARRGAVAVAAPPRTPAEPPSFVGKYLASFLNHDPNNPQPVQYPSAAPAAAADGGGTAGIEAVLSQRVRGRGSRAHTARARPRSTWTVHEADDWIQTRQRSYQRNKDDIERFTQPRVFVAS